MNHHAPGGVILGQRIKVTVTYVFHSDAIWKCLTKALYTLYKTIPGI